MRREYVDTPEGQVHYVTEGSGRPVLLLNMSPRSWTMYRRMIPLLSRGHRVLVMDTLGFGNSDPAPSSYRQLGDYTRNVAHFLDALGVQETDVCGFATGSLLAMEVAATLPKRVRRLILMSFPIFLTPEERRRCLEEAQNQARSVLDTDGSYLNRIFEIVLGKRAAHGAVDEKVAVDREYLADWIVDAVKAGPAFDEMAAMVHRHDSQARLPFIQADTLVIGLTGENTGWFIRGEERARAVWSLIPRSKLVMMSGPHADREVTYARPGDLTEIMLRFLEASDPLGGSA